MTIRILKVQVPYAGNSKPSTTNAFCFIPDKAKLEKGIKSVSLFTHGFTSHKGSILNWSLRLAEEGVPGILFDLPGHYLGGFTEVESFEKFASEAPLMFESALAVLKENITFLNSDTNLLLGGHSLGALLSLKALDLCDFSSFSQVQAICVGFGLPPQGVTHIFDTPFYKSTLAIRAQLVSEAINPDVIFPWIKEEKENLSLTGHKVYLLTGEDDVVVGKDGSERLRDQLESLGNSVVLEKPAKLAHHLPESAAPHIKKWVKDSGYFS